MSTWYLFEKNPEKSFLRPKVNKFNSSTRQSDKRLNTNRQSMELSQCWNQLDEGLSRSEGFSLLRCVCFHQKKKQLIDFWPKRSFLSSTWQSDEINCATNYSRWARMSTNAVFFSLKTIKKLKLRSTNLNGSSRWTLYGSVEEIKWSWMFL